MPTVLFIVSNCYRANVYLTGSCIFFCYPLRFGYLLCTLYKLLDTYYRQIIPYLVQRASTIIQMYFASIIDFFKRMYIRLNDNLNIAWKYWNESINTDF